MGQAWIEKKTVRINGGEGRASSLMKAGDESVPLVMLPGWPFGSEMFGDVMKMAQPEEAMVGVDYPGWGESEFGGGYSLRNLSLFVNGLVTALEVPKVDLLGVSFGATIAATYSTLFPEKVRSLVLNALPVYYPEYLTGQQKFLLSVVDNMPGLIPVIRDMMNSGNLAIWAAIVRTAPVMETDLDRRVFDQIRWANTAAMVEAVKTVSRIDLREVLPKIVNPTLLMVGRDDYVAPDSLKAFNLIPNSSLVRIPGTHSAIREHPEEFMGEVRKFRSELDGKIGE